jgi:hypothetical protein
MKKKNVIQLKILKTKITKTHLVLFHYFLFLNTNLNYEITKMYLSIFELNLKRKHLK